ncbi:MAG: SDR family oxidoreductase [Bacteroidales bacterium]|nr:SDR family oxidoreductase [Bacteroidales bacterium]
MNILINGGSRGIGREVAKIMSSDRDNQILVTGRDESALKHLSDSMTNENVSYLVMDLADIGKSIKSIKNHIYSRFSRIDILINSAGALTVKDFMKISEREARIMMETNFFGPATLIKMVAPIMGNGSHIVNISSMGGYQGSSKYKGMAYYSASKASIACLTECLAVEFSGFGISVNCLSLGAVQTEMFKKAFPGFEAPVKPAQMAEFITYFAVNGNRFFNGKILPVAVSNP